MEKKRKEKEEGKSRERYQVEAVYKSSQEEENLVLFEEYLPWG